jgi:DUF3006 family protein
MPPRSTTSSARKSSGAKKAAGKSAAKQSSAKKPATKSATKSARKSTSTRSAVTTSHPADGDAAERDPVQRHRWVVDVIEEDSAAVEVDGRSVTPVPRWMLPVGARQGDVLAVSHRREDVRSVLTIEIDRAATNAAYSASGEQVARGRAASAGRDGGGDVKL